MAGFLEFMGSLPGGPYCVFFHEFGKEGWCVMAFCTEHAFEIAHKAAELAGGMGVMKVAPFEKLLRDAFCIKHTGGGNYLKRFKVAAGL